MLILGNVVLRGTLRHYFVPIAGIQRYIIEKVGISSRIYVNTSDQFSSLSDQHLLYIF